MPDERHNDRQHSSQIALNSENRFPYSDQAQQVRLMYRQGKISCCELLLSLSLLWTAASLFDCCITVVMISIVAEPCSHTSQWCVRYSRTEKRLLFHKLKDLSQVRCTSGAYPVIVMKYYLLSRLCFVQLFCMHLSSTHTHQRWKVTNYIYSRYCNWVLCLFVFSVNFHNLADKTLAIITQWISVDNIADAGWR